MIVDMPVVLQKRLAIIRHIIGNLDLDHEEWRAERVPFIINFHVKLVIVTLQADILIQAQEEFSDQDSIIINFLSHDNDCRGFIYDFSYYPRVG